VSDENGRTTRAGSSHYSYTHYEDPSVAAGFDAQRFGGPIGEYLLDSQASLIKVAFGSASAPRILDVGTGTGRAALTLLAHGAHVVGVDASAAMLGVAHARAAERGHRLSLGRADAQRLPFADRSFDGAVCLRVLMHAVDWRACVAELCRVTRWRVVLDFPALVSFAAVESGVRRVRRAFGQPVEAYRVLAEVQVAAALRAGGFRIALVHRQFVMPIAFHKAVGRLTFTKQVERALRGVGLLGLMGSPVTLVAER
jgi:SAM-dependent methyltransferase